MCKKVLLFLINQKSLYSIFFFKKTVLEVRYDFFKKSHTACSLFSTLQNTVWHFSIMSYRVFSFLFLPHHSVGMTFHSNVIPLALICHIQEHGMTLPWNVIPPPEIPYDLSWIYHTALHFISFIHTRIHRLSLFLPSNFSSFWDKTCWSLLYQA